MGGEPSFGDLRALHDAVKARDGVPGQAPPAPELMMAL